MKKIMVIADTHGRSVWKMFGDINYLLQMEVGNVEYDIVPLDYNYYVFLGDYCDSFVETNNTIKENLLEIIRFKKLYPNNVILLWGNHELHYVLDQPWASNGKHMCSGYRPESHYELYEILNKNYDLFQLAFQYNNYLFTHAGVHIGWYQYRFKPQFEILKETLDQFEIEYKGLNLAGQLNIAFNHHMEAIFDIGHKRGGHAKVGGPLWLDKSLAIKPLTDYHQIVGHTAVGGVSTLTKNENTSITFTDVLHHSKAFYSVNIK